MRQHVRAIVAGLDAAAFAQGVACPNPADYLQPGTRAGFALPLAAALHPRIACAAARRLAAAEHRFRPHVIHAHGLQSLAVVFLSQRLGGPGIPCLVTLHNELPSGGRLGEACGDLLLRLAFRPAHAVIAVSQALLDQLRSRRLVRPEHAVLVPNGIDPGPFTAARDRAEADPAWRAHQRMALGCSPAATLITVVARLAPGKGLEAFLAALATLVPHYPGLVAAIAGEGPLREPLAALADRLGLGGQVLFLGYRADIPAVLAVSDAFCLPSRSEGLPLAVLEAMAAALPVVATAVGGIPEAVQDEVTGFLIPRPEATSAALARLLADPARAAAFGRAGQKRVKQHYDLRAMLARLQALYLESRRR